MSALIKRLTSLSKQLWFLHWVVSICLICVYMIGILMTHLWNDAPFRSYLITSHKSGAILILGLLIVRIGVLLNLSWQKYTHRPPRFTQRWLQMTALHTILYIFMIAVPISGIFYSNTNDRDAVFFGLILPRLFNVNESVSELSHDLHTWFAYTFLAFILLHLLEQRKFIQRQWRRFLKNRATDSE